jgi:hypothetical protein
MREQSHLTKKKIIKQKINSKLMRQIIYKLELNKNQTL